MNQIPEPTSSLVISYMTLRRAVGWIGILLPVVLIGYSLFFRKPSIFEPSISHYYYTGMGDVFVGALCVIGFMLFSYKGYKPKGRWRWDDIAGDVACVFAVGVALFPTAPTGEACPVRLSYCVHGTAAGLLFVTLACFSLFLFTRTDSKTPSRQKLRRNAFYRACGYTILSCILLILVAYGLRKVLPKDIIDAIHPVLWLESIAIIAFSFSWLIKGEEIKILNDEP